MADVEVLSTLITALVVKENPPAVARETLRVLKKVVDNAKQPDEKFRRLPGNNKNVREKVLDVVGGSEFLDAVGFVREPETGDWVMRVMPEPDFLDSASALLASAAEDLGPGESAPPTAAKAQPQSTSSTTSTSTSTTTAVDAEYEARKRASEERAAELRRRKEEEKAQREALLRKLKAEQNEARDRPVTASHRVDRARPAADAAAAGGMGGNAGAGAIPYVNSDRELQTLISSGRTLLVNYTASWCGPCRAIAPHVETLRPQYPNVFFCKVDIDENQESAQRNGVSAVPTFHLYRGGSRVGEVRGANLGGIQSMLAQHGA